jgi:CHAT domain-containing protein
METSPSARFGVGRNSGALLLAASLSLPWCSAAAQAEDQAWVEQTEWPYTHSVSAERDASIVIVEQAGVDLGVRLRDGSLVNSPLGRSGPEIIYVAAEEATRIEIAPRYSAIGTGAFRITRTTLASPPMSQLARLVFAAGTSFGSSSTTRQAEACATYRQASEVAGLDERWANLARLFTTSCYVAMGQAITLESLASIDAQFSFLGVPRYSVPWLRAELLYASLDYRGASRELEAALGSARTDLESASNRIAIRHDVADIKAFLGGTLALVAFLAGQENTLDGLDEKQLLLQRSRTLLDAAASEARDLGDAYVLGRAYDFRAALHFVTGENARVIENLLLAKQELTKTGNPAWLTTVLGSIGDFHKRLGEWRAAQEAYLESLRIIGDDTANGKYADVYHNAGVLYYEIGDYPRARRYIEASVDISSRTGREARAFTNSRQLALILEKQGAYQEARALDTRLIEYFGRSDRANGGDSWSPYRIMAQTALSRVEHKLGNIDAAWSLSAEALAKVEARAINAGTDLPAIYINHANILFDRGETTAAFQILDRIVSEYEDQPIRFVDLLAAKMTLLQRMGDTQAAIAVADRAFRTIESQRMQIDAVRLGPYWSGRTNEIYASHVDYLLKATESDRSYGARAFAVTERARATSLRLRRLEMLVARNASNEGARDEWINLLAEVQRAQGSENTEADRLDFEQRLTLARERYFATNGIKVDPAALPIMPLDDVRRSLSPDTLLIQFVAGPENVWRLDIGRDQWSASAIGATHDVQALIAAALYELSQPYVRDQGKRAELSAQLFRGLALDTSTTNLLISPSDALSSFPFSALQWNGEYLAERSTITLVPSVSEYMANRAEASSTPAEPSALDIAVLADPAFEGLTVPSAAYGSEPMRSWADSLQRLPASAAEANDLSRYYPDDRRLLLLGADATQRNFLDKRIRSAKIIHIATHGYFDENVPELIGFAVAKGDGQDDGFVSMAEISGQDFSAELVVISACSTGRGQEIAGEGSMSLARAFLAQGVNAVVSTSWPVSDAATAIFMKEFYRALNDEQRPLAEALRTAQQALRNTPRFRDPFYWSSYTLSMASRAAASPDRLRATVN